MTHAEAIAHLNGSREELDVWVELDTDGDGYIVHSPQEGVFATKNLLTAAMAVGAFMHKAQQAKARAEFAAESQAAALIASARFGLCDMDAHDRWIAAAAKAARKAGKRGGA